MRARAEVVVERERVGEQKEAEVVWDRPALGVQVLIPRDAGVEPDGGGAGIGGEAGGEDLWRRALTIEPAGSWCVTYYRRSATDATADASAICWRRSSL